MMKYLFVLILIPFALQAQQDSILLNNNSTLNSHNQEIPISQGKFLLNGSFSFESASGDAYEIKYYDYEDPNKLISTENDNIANIMVKSNYFIINGLCAGATLMFSSAVSHKIQSFLGLGLQAAYFLDLSTKEKPNTTYYPYIGISYLKGIILGDRSHNSQYNYGYSIGPGLMLMLTNSVALNFEVFYQNDTFNYEEFNSITYQTIKSSISGSKIVCLVGISASL